MTIVFAILLFSFLIFIHELGHFVAAKLSGVQVNEFALFMGPAIWKKQIGKTLYTIRTIPIGGYCAMEGEEEETDNPAAFTKAAWWKRLIILVAGASMNFLAGVLLFTIVFMPAQQIVVPAINTITDCSLLDENGLQQGDLFLEIDGEPVYVHTDVDVLLTISTKDIHDVVVLRNGEKISLPDSLEPHTCLDEKGQEYVHYGFSYGNIQPLDFAGKLDYIWKNVINSVRNVRLSMQMIVSGQAGLKDVSGPVGIVSKMNDMAEQSQDSFSAMMNMLYFGGFIAINLAVMNLLPIPALDGGRMVGVVISAAYESITKKRLDPKYEGIVHAVGMVLLLVLMAIIMFKDVFTIFMG